MDDLEEPAFRKIASDVLEIRLSVLRLGEAAEPPWWHSRFLADLSLRFLERLYPRSAVSAAVYSANKAACEIHDQAIGRQGVYHLFRLPINLEREVGALLHKNDDVVSELQSIVREPDGSRSFLAEFASTAVRAERIGPVRIGTTNDILRPDSYRLMAAVYLEAFDLNHRSFPYFEIWEGQL